MNETQVRPAILRRVPDTGAFLSPHEMNPVLQSLYAARGVRSATELDYGLHRLLPVSSLHGVDKAVRLLLEHRHRKLTVVGDFDADGATSTALVLRCLRKFGFDDVEYLVPNRFRFGYGLTPEIVSVAAERSPDLLITVDNGVSSIDGVAAAQRCGIRVLITDHHLPGTRLPDADAMINPNLPDSGFASPHLAGVGVAFYLMAALGRALESEGHTGAARVPAGYLDLVALGTVADVVALDHNNRILVSQGLKRIRAGRSVAGIQALFQVASKSAHRAVSADLGFIVAPRLNAAGRLEDMSIGIECLLADDMDTAMSLATTLDRINRERRVIEEKMREEAFAYVNAMDARNLPDCVCLFDPRWHQGIVGLVAARVRERCNRPAIAFAADSNGELKGSARSVPGVHIRDLLESVSSAAPGLVGKFGGHAMAAGLNLAEENFTEFSRLATMKLRQLYPQADFSGAIVTDGSLPRSAMNLDFARMLRQAGPWGAGFPEPVFSGEFTVDEQRTVGENHLKLKVRPISGGMALDAIAFNQAGPALRGVVNLIYRLDVNEYRGVESAQLIVEQIAALAEQPGCRQAGSGAVP